MLLVLRAPTMSFLPFYTAEERGFFEQQGVKVRCIHSHEEKRRAVRLTAEGEIAFYTSLSAIVEGMLRGWGEVRALCATSQSTHPCIAREEIGSLADLKGRKVMVGSGRSYNEVLWLCKRYGWEPGKDIEIVPGELSERANGFADPNLSAVFGRPQYLFWLKKGGYHLLPYPDADDTWPEAGLAAGLKLTQEQPEVVQKVVNAVVMATEFVRRNRDEAINVTLRNVPYLDREAVEGNYDVLRQWYTNEITEAGVTHQAEVLTIKEDKPRHLKLQEVADLSFLQEVYKVRNAKGSVLSDLVR